MLFTYTEAPEFDLTDVLAEKNTDGTVTIRWSATVRPGIPIVFEVLKGMPGSAFKVVAAYHADNPGTLEQYTFF